MSCEPATPEDAKGLLLAAVENPDPVLIFEHKGLYQVRGPVPEGRYTTPIGKAAIRRAGSSVTDVASSVMVHRALEAAEQLALSGIDVKVVDLRTVRPMDSGAILESVRKAARLVQVYEGVYTLGVGAEVSAMVAENDAFDCLDAPIFRIGRAECRIPYNPALERAAVPQVEDIVEGVRSMMEGKI